MNNPIQELENRLGIEYPKLSWYEYREGDSILLLKNGRKAEIRQLKNYSDWYISVMGYHKDNIYGKSKTNLEAKLDIEKIVTDLNFI